MIQKEQSLIKAVFQYLKMALGACIFSVGLVWFMSPAGLIVGGVTGISMVINSLVNIPVGTLGIIINIPIFLLAFKEYGFKFMLSSLVGMLFLYISIDIFTWCNIEVTKEPILAAIYGGGLTGLGLGLIFSTGATTGGSDVLAKFLKKRKPHFNMGTAVLAIDLVVIFSYALIFNQYDNAMYTIISLYICSRVIDLVLYGLSQCKLCHIISESSEEIKTAIVESLDRGVTVLEGRGAYSGAKKQILFCVVKQQQIVAIKKIVNGIDERAFVIVSDARSVFGEGFTSINYDI